MSSIKESLSTLVTFLETYRGRDKVIRLVTYGAMFLGGEGKTPRQQKWRKLSSEMSGCRVILRLFDDLSMLLYNMSTSFGLKEKGILKPLELSIALFNQAYYPSEHLAWLRQKSLLAGSPTLFSLLGLIFWTLSLLGEIIKSFIKIRNLNLQAKNLHKQKALDRDSVGYSSSQNAEIEEKLKAISRGKKDLVLLIIQHSSDFINAISWMPPGVLWAGMLKPSTNGIIGTIGTVIMIYRNWPSKKT
ncbi:peroxisomal membrane protein 11C-like [Physella acuta]|uniref:peroxisomal membrane protein 11C-like n=1 Tax=Physella acuta TaxID=109671 RepID=UPI0027DB03BD|nr:peroxisomal membrane protein 11C-like [Physella acuta]XP_059141152.1 peroxisomal membrane protein 11C-like [Physella acuta]